MAELPNPYFLDGISDAGQRSQCEAVFNLVADHVEKCMRWATDVFWTCHRAPAPGLSRAYYHHAPLMVAWHAIESIDGVGVLLRRGAVNACAPLLRSAIEAQMGLAYILEKDTEDRAMAYLVYDIHTRIADNKKFDPGTMQGKDFHSKLKNDEIWNSLPPLNPPEPLTVRVQKQEAVLQKTEYAKAEAEWQRLKGLGKKFNWYTMFSGPANVLELAKATDQLSTYELLYRNYSDSVHAGNAAKRVFALGDGKMSIQPLRLPTEIERCAQLTVAFCAMVATNLIQFYVKEEDKGPLFSRYVHDIMPVQKSLDQNRLKIQHGNEK